MYYLPGGDENARIRIGRCPWWGGDNKLDIQYVETEEQEIECFLQTEWSSVEGETVTLPNACVLPSYGVLQEFWLPLSSCPGPQRLGLDAGIAKPKFDFDGSMDTTVYRFNPSGR